MWRRWTYEAGKQAMKQQFEALTYEVIDQIGVMTFTTPETRNALSLVMRVLGCR